MDTIAYNLIIMLFDSVGYEKGFTGIDDPAFKDFVCTEAAIDPDHYDQIMGVEVSEVA